MGLVLLRDEFPLEVRRANWEFYKDRSLNFSSMSFAINALMAVDAGDLEEAYKYFIITTGMDLDEALTGRKDTYAGLHGTACGGAWLAAIFGFGGVHVSVAAGGSPAVREGEAREGEAPAEPLLRIDPNLPPKWAALRFNLILHGVTVNVAMDRKEVTIAAGQERKLEIPIVVAGRRLMLKSGEIRSVPLPSER
jgi:trehalose/maltose hydrolase-like predicted phosphorylase